MAAAPDSHPAGADVCGVRSNARSGVTAPDGTVTHPRDPGEESFLRLADAYRQEGLVTDAVRICREGLARWPGSLRGRLLLGECLLDQGALGEALIELGRVEREARGDPEILALLGAVRWAGRQLLPDDKGSGGETVPAEEPRVLRLDLPGEVGHPPEDARGSEPLLASATLADLYTKQGDAATAEAIRRRMADEREAGAAAGHPRGRQAAAYLQALRQMRENLERCRSARARRLSS
jgi:hypothetical protein